MPAMLLFVVFMFIPIVQVFVYSFSDWNGLSTPIFNGLTNYIELLSDRAFPTAHRNQLIFAVFITVYQMVLATVLAITVSDKLIKGRKFLRVLISTTDTRASTLLVHTTHSIATKNT